jgi:hypothetical protein
LALAQKSSLGYWNGKMAWDRVDGKAKRNPSISYSRTYKAWRIAKLDGHLAYDITNDDVLPTVDKPWNVYKKGQAPAPKITIHDSDPRPKKPNTLWITIEGSGTAECDGLYCPSTAPEKVSESGTVSSSQRHPRAPAYLPAACHCRHSCHTSLSTTRALLSFVWFPRRRAA